MIVASIIIQDYNGKITKKKSNKVWIDRNHNYSCDYV